MQFRLTLKGHYSKIWSEDELLGLKTINEAQIIILLKLDRKITLHSEWHANLNISGTSNLYSKPI
jgi:hypothetical protein